MRRRDGPRAAFDYALPVIATTDRLIENSSETAAAVVRAVVASQAALKRDVSLAATAGRNLFPPTEAELITEVVARDIAFYDASLSRHSVAALNQFARDVGLLDSDVPYEDVVAVQFQDLWAP